MSTPPPEPMLAFATTASLCYVLLWWVWWSAIRNVGVELEYSDGEL